MRCGAQMLRFRALQHVLLPGQFTLFSFCLKDVETRPSPGKFQCRGGSQLRGFCRALSPPFPADCGLVALFFLGRPSHLSPVGSPPDLEGRWASSGAPAGPEAIPRLVWKVIFLFFLPLKLSKAHRQTFLEAP